MVVVLTQDRMQVWQVLVNNSTSQKVSVVCGASDILGAAANYTTLIYEGKSWFDSGAQTNDMD